jgi:general secretion pathway protein N
VTRRGLFCLGLGAYVLGLIATAPATLVDAGLQRASNGRLGIAEAQGTLWTGAGQLEWHNPDRHGGISQDMAWRFLPQTLLLGHATWEIELGPSSSRFPVTVSLSRIEITDARIHFPAAELGLAAPRLAPLELRGDMLLHIAHISIGRGGRLNGDANLQWRGASSALAPVAPLGDYELRLFAEDATGHALLRTLQGPLQLDGKGSWSSGVAPVFQATVRVPREHQLELAPLLRLIAVERSDGQFELGLK